MQLDRQSTIRVLRALVRPVSQNDRSAVAMLEVFNAFDANFDARGHGTVVTNGCITSGKCPARSPRHRRRKRWCLKQARLSSPRPEPLAATSTVTALGLPRRRLRPRPVRDRIAGPRVYADVDHPTAAPPHAVLVSVEKQLPGVGRAHLWESPLSTVCVLVISEVGKVADERDRSIRQGTLDLVLEDLRKSSHQVPVAFEAVARALGLEHAAVISGHEHLVAGQSRHLRQGFIEASHRQVAHDDDVVPGRDHLIPSTDEIVVHLRDRKIGSTAVADDVLVAKVQIGRQKEWPGMHQSSNKGDPRRSHAGDLGSRDHPRRGQGSGIRRTT